MISKDFIIREILRTTQENNGKPIGQERFISVTSIKATDWQRYWPRWSDALREAGLNPNSFISPYSDEYILEKLISLIRQIKHYPAITEIRIQGRADNSFPSHTVFNRLGKKDEIVLKLYNYILNKPEYNDIFNIVEDKANTYKETAEFDKPILEDQKIGYVYLIKHGTRNEYKIGRTYDPLRREGEIKLQLPEKVEPIHMIKTDDPAGIEKYWHSRFSDKRKNGEWFELNKKDVISFKKWKKII